MKHSAERNKRGIGAVLALAAASAFVGGAAASHVAPTVRDIDMANLPNVESEVSIVVDPSDPNHLAAGTNARPSPPELGQRWYVSNNGGRSWSTGQLPYGTLTVPGPDPTMSDPSLDFGSNNEIYYSAILHAGEQGTLFVTVSEDDGASWTDPANGVVAAADAPLVFHDKEMIAVDRDNNDNVYVVWTPGGTTDDGQVVFSRDLGGISNGLNFSAPAPISDPGCVNQGADLAVGGGALYVAWTRFCGGTPPADPGTVYVAKSMDQGANWSTPVAAATLENVEKTSVDLRARSFPSIDVDPVSGRVFVVYATYTDVVNRTDADVMLVSSPDGSSGSWTSPIRVNQDSGTSDQWKPWLEVANGRVHVCFHTRAYDGGNVNFACSYGAISASPGLTEVRVSSASTAAASDLPLGDYTGAYAGADEVLHPAWGDGRSGVGGPVDAYTARVDFSPPTGFTVAPLTQTVQVDGMASLTATVTGAHGEPERFIPVNFNITSSGDPFPLGGGGKTNAAGQVVFSYTNALPGTDTVHVFADLDEDGTKDAGETLDTTVTWQLPASTDSARVTGDGTVEPSGGGVASFALSAQKKATDPLPKGNLTYSAPGLVVASTAITAVVLAGDDATIFGTGTVNGSGSVAFRADVKDGGEPGTNDQFRIRLVGGYDSQLRYLTSGNITTH